MYCFFRSMGSKSSAPKPLSNLEAGLWVKRLGVMAGACADYSHQRIPEGSPETCMD